MSTILTYLAYRALQANREFPNKEDEPRHHDRRTAQGNTPGTPTPAYEPPNPGAEKLAAYAEQSAAHFRRARELIDGTGAPRAEGEYTESHIRESVRLARQNVNQTLHGTWLGHEELGAYKNDDKVFQVMGTDSAVYHGLLSRFNQQAGDAELQYGLARAETGPANAYEIMTDSLERALKNYNEAAMQNVLMVQSLPLDGKAAQAGMNAALAPIMRDRESDLSYFEQVRKDEGLKKIQQVLAEVRNAGPDTRAAAAEEIKVIIDDVHASPENLGDHNIDPDVVDNLKDPQTAHPQNIWGALVSKFTF